MSATASPCASGKARTNLAGLSLLLMMALLTEAPRTHLEAQDLPEGITPRIVQAVQNALQWLATHQKANGSWASQGCRGNYPIAMTGLAGLALVASGSTPTRGPYALNIRHAIRFLLSQQRPNGHFVGVQENRSMYGHGYAMLFLSQIYGMQANIIKEQRVQQALSNAVALAQATQCAAGGWGYSARSMKDEGSVSVVLIQGLRGCRNTGILVPKKIITCYLNYLQKLQNADGGISYSSSNRGRSRGAITAAATAGILSAGAHQTLLAQRCLKYCRQRLLARGMYGVGNFYYLHLYLAQVMYRGGTQTWSNYLQKIKARLLNRQKSDGAFQGEIGPCYSTAITCLIFLLPYENIPLFQR